MAAKIKWIESTYNSITVCLDGLSGVNYTANDRIAYWYLDMSDTEESSTPFGQQELAGSITSTEDIPFMLNGLSMPEGTIHYIRCVILNTSGTVNKTLKTQIKTGTMLLGDPWIAYCHINQVSSSPPVVVCRFGVEYDNINELTRYEITVETIDNKGYEVETGFILGNMERVVKIELDSLSRYIIKVRVFNGVYFDENSRDITLGQNSGWTARYGGTINGKNADDSGDVYKDLYFVTGVVTYFKIISPYSGSITINRIAGMDVSKVSIFLADHDFSNKDIEFGMEDPNDFLASGTSSITYTIKRNVEYHCWVRATEHNTYGDGLIRFAFPTKNELISWDWERSNNKASALQTSSAYKTITNTNASDRKLSYFSYLVWNDMVDKVLEIQDIQEMSWDSTYATSESTKMTATDKILTATRFNSLRKNIDTGSFTEISEVSKGDTVKGSYFTTLTTHINNWIGKI